MIQLWVVCAEGQTVAAARQGLDAPGLAFSPSEDRIASGSGNGTVQLWDGQTGLQQEGDLENRFGAHLATLFDAQHAASDTD